MKNGFLEKLNQMPIVASVKDDEGLNEALDSECLVVFVLYGDICSIQHIVHKINEANKLAIVHIDMIEGLTNREIAVRYIAENTRADGIISTRPGMIKVAKEMNLFAIQRFFLIDSIALENFRKQREHEYADAIEILPGVMPKVIKMVVESCTVPVIIGGLIADKEDVMSGLQSGAVAVSSTNRDIWFLL